MDVGWLGYIMNNAAKIGFRAGIRTVAQTASGLLGGVVIVDLSGLGSVGEAILIAAASSLIAGLVAFLQNFAENY